MVPQKEIGHKDKPLALDY